MNKLLCTIFLIINFIVIGICQTIKIDSNTGKCRTNVPTNQTCPPNPDALYDRQKVLEHLAKVLDKSIPGYRNLYPKVTAKNGRALGFFVYDLTNPVNKSVESEDCINFENNHIYHFSLFDYSFSFSQIVILENGKLKVFKSINCQNSEDSLEDVLSYLEQKLKDEKDKEKIIERVRAYRKYGSYFRLDNFTTLRCKEVHNTGIEVP
jgi:hypothetical protein